MAPKRITTGTIAMSEDAKRNCHSVLLRPMKDVTPTVRGWRSGVLISVRAITYSFQAAMKQKITAVTSPGPRGGMANPPQRLPARAAVAQPRLLELGGDVLEVRVENPDREG